MSPWEALGSGTETLRMPANVECTVGRRLLVQAGRNPIAKRRETHCWLRQMRTGFAEISCKDERVEF